MLSFPISVLRILVSPNEDAILQGMNAITNVRAPTQCPVFPEYWKCFNIILLWYSFSDTNSHA